MYNQDFSKILVVLGFEIQGGEWGVEVGTPIRLMEKFIRVKTTTCQCYRHNYSYVPMLPSVQVVGVRQNFVQERVYFWAARARRAKRAAPSPK